MVHIDENGDIELDDEPTFDELLEMLEEVLDNNFVKELDFNDD